MFCLTNVFILTSETFKSSRFENFSNIQCEKADSTVMLKANGCSNPTEGYIEIVRFDDSF